jgi:peptidyl-dipeptidase A
MKKNSLRIGMAIMALGIAGFSGCMKEKQITQKPASPESIQKAEAAFQECADAYTAKAKPAYIAWWSKYFAAAVSGKKADWDSVAMLEIAYNNILADRNYFAQLKQFRESGLVRDSLKARQLVMMYNEAAAKQIDTAQLNAITRLQAAIEQKYGNFRATVDGKALTDNDVEDILSTSRDSKRLEAVWCAQKKIGRLVEKEIRELVKMRNEAARNLGYPNFHTMSLALSEQDPAEVTALFDELDTLTSTVFRNVKNEADGVLSSQLKCAAADLMPWHYQNRFFQEAPKVYAVNFDVYYKGKDVVKLTDNYYRGIGIPIDDIIAKSDLYEKPGKNQHAFSQNIDRDARDIRILCNVKPTSGWMNTMLHEFGHAAYEKYYDTTLPWILKQPAHTFTTEAIAIFFGNMATDPCWMFEMGIIDRKDVAKLSVPAQKMLRLERLVFSRWSQVMYRFEKSMYENPDQDLNALWWSLVEKYQLLKKPAGRNEPDWAAKIHIATVPCYYHNYLIGYLLGAQIDDRLRNLLPGERGSSCVGLVNRSAVGEFLIDKIFFPGARYYWNDMIERATGEKLSPKYFAAQIGG